MPPHICRANWPPKLASTLRAPFGAEYARNEPCTRARLLEGAEHPHSNRLFSSRLADLERDVAPGSRLETGWRGVGGGLARYQDRSSVTVLATARSSASTRSALALSFRREHRITRDAPRSLRADPNLQGRVAVGCITRAESQPYSSLTQRISSSFDRHFPEPCNIALV